MAKLVSVNVGLPKNIEWSGRTVYTGIWKTAVDGARIVRKLNIDGDGQGDLQGHGGENRAVYVYQLSSYTHWETELHRSDFTMGQFGENFTVDGLPDDEVCIGDRYKIGTALFEVSQPRVTCYRIGIRMNEPRMAALLTSQGKPGFYFRVLEEGEVQAGDTIDLVSKGPESMTVAEINAQLYLPNHSREEMERALRIPALSSGWRASFQALLNQGEDKPGNSGISPADLAPAAFAGFRDARIATLKRETSDVVVLEIESADGKDLTTPDPGQFVVLKVQPPSEAPVMRSFSICDVPRPSMYQLGIKCEPHAIAGPYLRDVAKVGDPVQVSAPRGSFVLHAGDEPVVLLSAGIGVTPVLAMLHALAGQRSPREVWWLYAARNGSEHPFASEARTLLRELAGSQSHIWYSKPNDTDIAGRDFDSVGHIDVASLPAMGVKPAAGFYLCGPPSFLEDMRAALIAWGVASDRIYAEIFGSGPSVTPGVLNGKPKVPPHGPPGAPGTGPTISFARSGVAARWSTTYQTLLEFAEACDVPVRWSCRTGVCHTCESGLISGDVTYNPEPLDPPARGDLLICCSTPRGDVILDL